MWLDARTVDNQAVLDAQVCIIGAGPAGITIARELNGQDRKVILLESGGFERDPEIHALNEGNLEGDPYIPPSVTRARLFGGTANDWNIDMDNGQIGVRYVPLDPIDFEKRDWIPYSGWPITRLELDPYYARAHQVAQTGPYTYQVDAWATSDTPAIPFKGDRMTTQMFQFGPKAVFTQNYRRELEQSSNVTVLTYGTALELETDELAQRVTGVRVKTPRGPAFTIRADTVILSQGGLEVARLLLLSRAQQTGGLGNGHDLVGRFLMDHPVIRPGVLVPSDRKIMDTLALYDARWVKGARVIAKPVLTEATLRREQLTNMATAIFPRPAWARYNPLRMVFPRGARLSSPAVKAAQTFKQALKQRRLPDQSLTELGHLLGGLDDLTYKMWRRPAHDRFGFLPAYAYNFGKAGWSALANKPKHFGCFDLLHVTEQRPDPTNRVVLSDDRDAFGCPKLTIHWHYTEADKRSVQRAMIIFAEEVAQAGLGRLHLEWDYGAPSIWNPSIHHHMGTTRMHESPTQGVVDAQGRVHGVANLFIASSSVFPTGGYANPTLTILALALRLADHIRQR
jgi:choline dehydrogenase-like flavoprotein